ncbi:TolC family outer membrane protein [Massilia niastensis]|uniref:TolC family outer membrane protein n=1 Tax=Massilia niastensis TaxID=544911 RepID=UPI00035F72E8|nr:TolC family outer membrane protein [Massilia niastensis]
MKKFSSMRLRAVPAALALLLGLGCGPAAAIDLVEAYHLALASDPASLAADQALVAGREKSVQGDALLRPRIDLVANVTRIHDRMNGDVPEAARALVRDDSSGTARNATLQLVQPLYDMAARADRTQMHELSALAQTRFDESRQALALRVAEAYFGVLVAEESLRVVQSEKEAVLHQRDRARARFDVGQGKITDVHEAQARLDAVTTREVSAASTLELRRTQFLETVGTAPQGLSRLAPSFAPGLPEPADLHAWQSRGESHSKLVRSRQSELAIAGAEVGKHRLEARPTLNLVASYGAREQSGNLSPLVAPGGSRDASLGLQLNIPLYAGGALDSRKRESVARRGQAEQELAAARRDVRLKVQEGYLAVTTGVSRIASLEQAMVSARSALEATSLGRDVGTRTSLDVLDARQRVHAVELDLIQARVDYLLGRLRLAAAAGELGEETLRALGAWLAS